MIYFVYFYEYVLKMLNMTPKKEKKKETLVLKLVFVFLFPPKMKGGKLKGIEHDIIFNVVCLVLCLF